MFPRYNAWVNFNFFTCLIEFVDKTVGFYDFLVENSLALTPEIYNSSLLNNSTFFAVDTKIPYLSFFQSSSKVCLSVVFLISYLAKFVIHAR